jgi:predicted DNA-binding protein with PD1-like motif
MHVHPIRLSPGVDIRHALEGVAKDQTNESAFVVAGIGSLLVAHLRSAGEDEESKIAGPLEILSLSGTLGP